MPLPPALIDEYKKQFTQMDQDGSGSVSNEELKGMLVQMGHSEDEVDDKFKQLDVNRDNKVSIDEFLGLVEKLCGSRDVTELEELFKLADEEGMGFIP